MTPHALLLVTVARSRTHRAVGAGRTEHQRQRVCVGARKFAVPEVVHERLLALNPGIRDLAHLQAEAARCSG